MDEAVEALLAALGIEQAENAVRARVVRKGDRDIAEDEVRRIDVRVGQVPEGRKNLAHFESAACEDKVADFAAFREDHHGIAGDGNEDFLGPTGDQRREIVGSRRFLLAPAHERTLPLEKRGRHFVCLAVGLKGDDEFAGAGVPVGDVRDRQAWIADGSLCLGLGIGFDQLAALDFARGVVWRDEDELPVRCAEDDFLFPFV